jgi:hypothetical protein
LTGYIGYQGLRTFDRWRREKIEGKRIDVALDALSTAYKSKYVFEYIRSPLVRSHEFADMPGRDDGKENRKQGEAPYAILKSKMDSRPRTGPRGSAIWHSGVTLIVIPGLAVSPRSSYFGLRMASNAA